MLSVVPFVLKLHLISWRDTVKKKKTKKQNSETKKEKSPNLISAEKDLVPLHILTLFVYFGCMERLWDLSALARSGTQALGG